jgi:hypothetical protein
MKKKKEKEKPLIYASHHALSQPREKKNIPPSMVKFKTLSSYYSINQFLVCFLEFMQGLGHVPMFFHFQTSGFSSFVLL